MALKLLLFKAEAMSMLTMILPCMQVTMRSTGQVLTASAQHNSEANTSKQQAALDLVHQLQQAILKMLTTSQPDKAVTTAMHTSSDHSSPHGMTVLHEGDTENSVPEIGNVVKVQYQLVGCPEGQRSLTPAGPGLASEENKNTNPAVVGELSDNLRRHLNLATHSLRVTSKSLIIL